jgi:hypothetical protein
MSYPGRQNDLRHSGQSSRLPGSSSAETGTMRSWECEEGDLNPKRSAKGQGFLLRLAAKNRHRPTRIVPQGHNLGGGGKWSDTRHRLHLPTVFGGTKEGGAGEPIRPAHLVSPDGWSPRLFLSPPK